MRYLCALVTILISFTFSYSQSHFSCAYNSNQTTPTCNLVSSENKAVDQSAINLVELIITEIGLPQNFVLVQCSSIENAFAITNKLGTRYIVIDENWIQSNKNFWFKIGVLAHEIGHHLCGHTSLQKSFTIGERQKMELEADRFAGFIMRKLGADKEDALTALNTLVPNESNDTYSTHPSRSKRITALTTGYNNNKQVFGSSTESAKDTSAEEYFNLAYREQPNPDENSDINSLFNALKLYEKAINKNSNYVDALSNCGVILFYISGYFEYGFEKTWIDQSISKLEKAISYAEEFESKELSGLYNNLGQCYSRKLFSSKYMQDYILAKRYFDEAISLYPRGGYFLNRGILFGNYSTIFRIDRMKDACSDFYKGCELGSNKACGQHSRWCR